VLTAQHGVAHGHAVGLTLGALFGFNGDVDEQDTADRRGAGFVRERMRELCALLGGGLPAEAGAGLTELMAEVHLKTRLRDVGVVRSDLEGLVRSVNQQRLANNPRKLSAAAIGRILEQVF
jgi:alcohol dehydrogenase class IV